MEVIRVEHGIFPWSKTNVTIPKKGFSETHPFVGQLEITEPSKIVRRKRRFVFTDETLFADEKINTIPSFRVWPGRKVEYFYGTHETSDNKSKPKHGNRLFETIKFANISRKPQVNPK